MAILTISEFRADRDLHPESLGVYICGAFLSDPLVFTDETVPTETVFAKLDFDMERELFWQFT